MRPMLTACVAALALWGCSAPPADVEVLRHYPLDSLEGVITRSAVALDEQVTSDGGGSLRISAAGPTTVRLFETGDIEAEAARLLFRARLRTEDLKGTAFLEMWVSVPGRGEFFSRGLTSPLTGTTDWATAETPFFLREGEDPDNVRLNVVVDGAGTVWVDDVRLLKGPLE